MIQPLNVVRAAPDLLPVLKEQLPAVLLNKVYLNHRGGQGSDLLTGDGAGVMVQLPHQFFQTACSQLSIPCKEEYGVEILSLPQETQKQRLHKSTLNDRTADERRI
ncbi:hypothetical protein A8F95_07865 [Bacillus wudalianchiensis]|uniref:Glutamine amidotransferase type-2 domain-containing protein n=2 Tax=Pseudobacillus wudalianchiensis TaxID=1743143 RepID=A0A1B9ATI7_9BACI|nr:hypothetical protein A8F95_07865 [Bacillus wudalianchiensis]